MQNTITMTTKGTFTMPAKVRRGLGVNEKGDRLVYTYDEKRGQMIIEKPNVNFGAVQQQLAKYTKGKKPLISAGGFYRNRKPRI